MFIGKHPSTLDKENRFSAPTGYQEELSGGAYIIQGFERNLLVFPPDAFEKTYQKISSQNLADPLVRSLLRLMLGSAHEINPDSSGRLALPDELREFARVGSEMLIIGQGDYFEVWQPDLWQEQEAHLQDTATNSDRFSTLIVTTR